MNATIITRRRNAWIRPLLAGVISILLLLVFIGVKIYQAVNVFLDLPVQAEIQGIKGQMASLQAGEQHQLEIYNDDAMEGFLGNLEMVAGIEPFELDIMYVRRIEKAFQRMKGLDSIGTLALSKTNLDDAGLASIATLPNLRELRLRRVRVTDEGLALLAQAPRLESFSLDQREGESISIPALLALPHLQRLTISESPPKPSIQPNLEQFNPGVNLKELTLNRVMATVEQVEALQRALPNTKIKFSYLR